jgi:hypothetical protein
MGNTTTPHARNSAAAAAPGDQLPERWAHTQFAESKHWGRPGSSSNPSEADFRRCVELDGFAVVPRLLSTAELGALRRATELLETTPRDYSSRQRGRRLAQHPGIDNALVTPGPLQSLLQQPRTTELLIRLFGGPAFIVSANYDCSHVGTPGISLHTDSQPYGSSAFGGTMFSCPVLVR